MSPWEFVLLGVTGFLAGVINAVVGSGSLVTFPTLVALGYPPVLANVTNNIGVLPGSISGALAYRKTLRGEWGRVFRLSGASVVGGALGAGLLLVLPAELFGMVVPVLIVLACVLVIAGPRLKERVLLRSPTRTDVSDRKLALPVGLTGVYGGYFGAAQGVILLSMLAWMLPGSLQRANGYKNVLAAAANASAAVVFMCVTPVAWTAAITIAVGAFFGGQIGGWAGQKLPELVYRIVIVMIGAVAVAYFWIS